MQVNKPLHIFHLIIKREFHLPENAWHHLCANDIMPVERPSGIFVPTLSNRLCNVMEQRSPSEPYIIRPLCHIVEHSQRMIKVIFMPYTTHLFHPPEGKQFRKYQFEQSRTQQKHPPNRRFRRAHYFHQLIHHPLTRYY